MLPCGILNYKRLISGTYFRVGNIIQFCKTLQFRQCLLERNSLINPLALFIQVEAWE